MNRIRDQPKERFLIPVRLISDGDFSKISMKNLYYSEILPIMLSHQVFGITNTPIVIKGEGYTQYMHLIARENHRSIVELVKEDVIKGWGK